MSHRNTSTVIVLQVLIIVAAVCPALALLDLD